jgi:hypothetical protein
MGTSISLNLITFADKFAIQLLEFGGGTMGWDVDARKVTIYDSGDRHFEASTVDQVCRAIISTLKHPNETKNTYVYVRSFVLTQNKILAILEKFQGPYEVTKDTAIEISTRGLDNIKRGNMAEGYPQMITGATYGPWGFVDFGERPIKWNEILGLPKEEDIEEVIQGVLKKKNLV